MGRPIKKKFFTAKAGSTDGNLTLLTTVGNEPIIKQTGTGVYEVASGRVKLMDGAPVVAAGPGVVGDAQLQHEGRNVRRINQYRITYFDDTGTDDAVWRNNDGTFIGTFIPAPTAEGAEPLSVQATPKVKEPKVEEVKVEEVEEVKVEEKPKTKFKRKPTKDS